MQEVWGFLNTGHLDAATNMALDEALLKWHAAGDIPPTLRFYGWHKPSLSIGQFQKIEGRIDLNALDTHGCEWVRRLTGGSAVLHDDELTYSIVVSENHPAIPSSVSKAYQVLTKGLYEGYKNLGIHASYANPTREESVKGRSQVCFEQAAVSELLIDGKKLSGNAQVRKDGVLLQHGSIPMSIDTDMLFDLFIYPSERLKERKRIAFKDKAIAINEVTGVNHTYDMLVDAFYDGFQKGLGVKFEPLTLTDEHWQTVQKIRSNYVEVITH